MTEFMRTVGWGQTIVNLKNFDPQPLLKKKKVNPSKNGSRV